MPSIQRSAEDESLARLTGTLPQGSRGLSVLASFVSLLARDQPAVFSLLSVAPLGVFFAATFAVCRHPPLQWPNPHFSVPLFTPLLIQQHRKCSVWGCQDKKAWPGLQKLTDVG